MFDAIERDRWRSLAVHLNTHCGIETRSPDRRECLGRTYGSRPDVSREYYEQTRCVWCSIVWLVYISLTITITASSCLLFECGEVEEIVLGREFFVQMFDHIYIADVDVSAIYGRRVGVVTICNDHNTNKWMLFYDDDM